MNDLEVIKKNAGNYVIGVVTSRFNEVVTESLHRGTHLILDEYGLANKFDISVAGAYEIPMAAQWLIEHKKCDAVIALGAVIRGETSHYDYVCAAAERGCMDVQLKTNVPVAFGVLTTENKEQAMARAGGRKGDKGQEAALVALEMLALKESLV